MTMDMQNLAVLCVLVTAAIHVFRRIFRTVQNKQSACCGCQGQCPATANQKQLISLDPPEK